MSDQSDPPRVAVIGAGYWGKNLVRNFNELSCLRAVCDADPDRLREVIPGCSGVVARTDYRDVLSDRDIDAVAIATPAASHGALVEEALVAGKDVFVEKPLCLSEAAGDALCRLARERDRVLMVGHLLWYHPAVVRLQGLVDAGELGRVHYVYSNRLNLGKLRREENVLWSFAPHDISVILGLVEEMPESVVAQGGNYLHKRIADTTVSLLSFASGIRAHIFVSWLHPFKEQTLVVVGDKGMAVFKDTAPWEAKLQVYPHSVEWSGNVPIANKAEVTLVPVEQHEPLKAECSHFLECVRTRAAPRTDGQEALRVLRVLNACQESLGTGRPVPLAGGLSIDDVQIHETAKVDPGVIIGSETRIWHFSHVLSGSRIGRRCNIGQNVSIGPNVRIGDGCKIQNNVSVYEGVTLEDEVFCGPSMVFTNVVNPRAHVSRKHEFKPTLVRRGATIGANATILCGVTLGRYAFVGAGAVVTRNVPDHAIVAGNPARQAGWMCACGQRLPEDLRCPACGSSYDNSNKGLIERI
jgi:UDP-2-acetamido-3-amino-2,3-dideoxy-glucuronate N-acetyltransferase